VKPRQSFEVWYEAIEDTFNVAGQTLKSIEHFRPICGGGLLEMYLQHKCSLHVELEIQIREPWGFPTDKDSCELHAIYEAPDGIGRQLSDFKLMSEDRWSRSQVVAGDGKPNAPSRAIHGRDGYRAVLVSVPEFVKQPKPVSLVAVPALIWLFVVEFGNEILIDQPQAIGAVSMPSGWRFSDWKTHFAPRRAPRRSWVLGQGGGLQRALAVDAKFPDELIQRTTQIVDTIPDDRTPDQHRQGPIDLEVEAHNLRVDERDEDVLRISGARTTPLDGYPNVQFAMG